MKSFTTNFLNLIKAELSGWKKHETIALLLIFAFIIINAFFIKDSVVAVVSAICGIMYSSLAGKGKVSCYVFGLMGSGCYSFLSLKNGLFGNLVLYLCYYIPMQIIGLFSWSKHLKDDAQEIEKVSLSTKQRILLVLSAIVLCSAAIFILKVFHGSSPFFDGITTVLSVFGMYLTVKRCIEQWLVWIVVNGLSSIMWLNLVAHGAKTYSTLIMWCVYFVLSVYFYFVWRKELKSTPNV